MKTRLKHITFIFLFLSGFGFAQNANVEFGNNRVQYKQWKWKYITTDHFIIYYYIGGNNLAYNAARYGERELKRIIQLTGYTPHDKIVMIVYNSVEDMQMSNIDLQKKAFIGGETDLIKSRIELAYPGTQIGFKQEVSRSLTELMIEVMLFGGSLRSQIQSSYILNIPPWFVEGAAQYISEGWSPELNDAIKSEIITKKKKPKNFVGNNAVLVGQSIWNYIAVEYGEDNIANILNLTRITQKEKRSIESTLGMPFNHFIKLWRGYYLSISDSLDQQTIEPSKKTRIRKSNAKRKVYKQVTFSPSGKKIAYTQNFLGRYKIKIYDTEKGRKKTFHKVGRRITDRPLNLNLPLIAWQTDTSLAMIVYKKGKISFLMKNTDSYKIAENNFKVIDEILGMDFSDDGKLVAFSALKDGQTDLFSYDYKRNFFKRLTFDLYDDVDPFFLKDSYKIVFSSNRLDTLLKADRGNFETIRDDFELYLVDPARRDTVHRLTHLEGRELFPKSYSKDEIHFLNSSGNQLALYKMNLNNPDVVTQVSNYKKNILNYAANPRDSLLAFIMKYKVKDFLYLNSNFDNSSNFGQRSNKPLKKEKITPKRVLPNIEDLNITDYYFEKENKKFEKYVTQLKKDSLQKVKENRVRIRGPYDYKRLLAIDHMINTPFFDQLRGFGVLQEINTSELFGDHRFNAGYYGDFSNFNVGRIYAEYLYLKRRFDIGIRYEREGIISASGTEDPTQNIVNQEYFINKFLLSVDYPFTPSTRISLSPGFETTRFTEKSEINQTLNFEANDVFQNYISTNTALVVDNTYEKGLNLLEGTRMKVGYKNYLSLGNKDFNFAKLYVDIRNYQRIHKEIIFATRLTGGKFLGNSKKNFLLGGMDNWLNQRTSNNPLALPNEEATDITQRDRSDALFQEYITSLRGFDYNERSGNNVAVFNAELRVPIFRYLFSRPINSALLRNFKLVGFSDIGTAWAGDGFNIYDESNLFESVTLIDESGTNLNAEIERYRGSVIYSYGAGLRTILFGYYIKMDLAWPKRLIPSNGKPAFYFTFGYDF